MALKRTRYVCQTCGGFKDREHHDWEEPITRDWRAKCTSPECGGRKRQFIPARRPITGGFR